MLLRMTGSKLISTASGKYQTSMKPNLPWALPYPVVALTDCVVPSPYLI
jgi:hypothetical protein